VVARGATYVAAKLASEGIVAGRTSGDVSQVPLAAKRNAEEMWALARSLLIWWRRPHFRNSLAYKCDLGARSVWHSAIGQRGVG
jgi:hypothetical protein